MSASAAIDPIAVKKVPPVTKFEFAISRRVISAASSLPASPIKRRFDLSSFDRRAPKLVQTAAAKIVVTPTIPSQCFTGRPTIQWVSNHSVDTKTAVMTGIATSVYQSSPIHPFLSKRVFFGSSSEPTSSTSSESMSFALCAQRNPPIHSTLHLLRRALSRLQICLCLSINEKSRLWAAVCLMSLSCWSVSPVVLQQTVFWLSTYMLYRSVDEF